MTDKGRREIDQTSDVDRVAFQISRWENEIWDETEPSQRRRWRREAAQQISKFQDSAALQERVRELEGAQTLKPLEWRLHSHGDTEVADTIIGRYEVWEGPKNSYIFLGAKELRAYPAGSENATIDALKSTAFNHYRQQILSALTPKDTE